MRRPLVFAVVVCAGIAVDLLSKWYVFSHLNAGESYAVIPNVLHFTEAENRGVAFSMLKDYPLVILSISVLAIAALGTIYWRSRQTASLYLLTSLALILIGAAGNLFDRLAFGYVRDFIDFVPRIPLIGHWAVFNVADMCITTGVLLYLFCAWFIESDPGEKNAAAGTTPTA
ncbi:MAG TPA: signal peptidase II [Planctomycetota bacterium]|nr:signal peptidase II [Planctomycetota bacterium]